MDINKSEFNQRMSKEYPQLVNNTELIVTDPLIKLEIIGKYLESINSPRYTNMNTPTKEWADDIANKLKKNKDNMRRKNATFTTFTNNNPAHDPKQNENEPKYLFSYIEIVKLMRKLKIKTSSGLDNIPTIVLKNLHTSIITDYTIIINNAINSAYYPNRWKEAKVLAAHPKEGQKSKRTAKLQTDQPNIKHQQNIRKIN
ncbi:hypothetical protein PV326_012414 [Microctonus aethiopoides]|nr:hypothetical protein PV326_012414 [Microctonus aethiopoides]